MADTGDHKGRPYEAVNLVASSPTKDLVVHPAPGAGLTCCPQPFEIDGFTGEHGALVDLPEWPTAPRKET